MMFGIMGSISNRWSFFSSCKRSHLGIIVGFVGIKDGFVLSILQAMIPRATMMGCRRFF